MPTEARTRGPPPPNAQVSPLKRVGLFSVYNLVGSLATAVGQAAAGGRARAAAGQARAWLRAVQAQRPSKAHPTCSLGVHTRVPAGVVVEQLVRTRVPLLDAYRIVFVGYAALSVCLGLMCSALGPGCEGAGWRLAGSGASAWASLLPARAVARMRGGAQVRAHEAWWMLAGAARGCPALARTTHALRACCCARACAGACPGR